MGKIKFVRKRDGRIVPFDKSKIADAIFKAAQSVGGHDRYLAEDLAEAVTLYLENHYNGDTPSVEEIQDIVERVLIKTGHAKTAKAYILYREKRSRIRRVKEGKTEELLKEKEETKRIREIMELSLNVRTSDEKISKWDRNKIVETLIRETGISKNIAEFIVMEVEELIISSKVKNLSTPIVRELVNAKLIEYGFEKEREKHSRLGVPLFDVGNLIKNYEKDPESLSVKLGSAIKKEFALSEVFSSEISQAHLRGEININSLAHIDKFFSISINFEFLKKIAGEEFFTFLHLLSKYFTKSITLWGMDTEVLERFSLPGNLPFFWEENLFNFHINGDIEKVIDALQKIRLKNPLIWGKYNQEIYFSIEKIDINLPKVITLSNSNIFNSLDEVIDKAVKSCIQKKNFVEKISMWDNIRKYIPMKIEKGIFLIGLSGIRKTIEIITGKQFHHKESINFFHNLIGYIREKLEKYSKQKELSFFITESEETSDIRFCKINQEEFGEKK